MIEESEEYFMAHENPCHKKFIEHALAYSFLDFL
jgi:hypothetical protein